MRIVVQGALSGYYLAQSGKRDVPAPGCTCKTTDEDNAVTIVQVLHIPNQLKPPVNLNK